MRRVVLALLLTGCGFEIRAAGSGDGGPTGGDARDGDPGTIDAPIDAPMLPAACAQLALGSDHSCALRDGNVYCWGDDFYGELGGGSQTTAVTLPTPTVHLSSRAYSTCAVAMDGTVRCWGLNDGGQLGDNTLFNRFSPVAVMGISDAKKVATGRAFTCALRSGGTVRCWGSNTSGQLGDGSLISQLTAAADVQTLAGIVAIGAGGSHACAQNAAGAAWCWGDNGYGQLGNGTTTDSPTPVSAPVSGVAQMGPASFSSGLDVGAHTCAIVGGQVRCWGDNAFGQLGNGTTTDSPTPVTVSGITDAVKISMGRWHVCALRASGRVSCWGRNLDGEVGDGTQSVRSTPVELGLTNVLEIGAGGFHSCAINGSRELYCWGYNGSGQLGIATGAALRHLSPTRAFNLCP